MLDEENGFYYKGNKRISLTAIEVALLSYFIDHKGELIRHRTLTTRLWGKDDENTRRNLKVVVYRINQKLRKELVIYSRISIGYRLIYLGGKER